jgi:hypothetical protein
MKPLFYNILLLLCLFLAACNQRPDVEERYSKTNLSIPKKYRLLDFKSDWAIGENTEDYNLVISKKDYQRISKEIETKTFFRRLDTGKVPIQAFTNNIDLKKINETACWYDNKYFYQIFRPDPGVVITIVLEKDSLMGIDYNDL